MPLRREPDPQIAFVHINKTAGTTMKFILRNSFGARHCDGVPQAADGIFRDDDLRFARRVFPGLRSLAGHSLIEPTAHLSGDIRYFTFLRDPLERCASQYQQIRRGRWRRRRWWKGGEQPTKRARRRGSIAPRKPDLDEFLGSERYRNLQVRRIAGRVDLAKAKEEIEKHYFFVGLTERFEESIRSFQALCPYPIDTRHARLRVAPDDALKRTLLTDPVLRERLREANAVDVELYEWVKQVVYPAQRVAAEAGTPAGGPGSRRRKHAYRISRAYDRLVYQQALRLRALLRDQPG